MNRKGNMAIIGSVLFLLIAIIVIVNVAIPQVKETTNAQSYTESLVYNDQPNNQNVTLTYTDMVSGSLSITGLTVNTNYTIDYDTGNVEFTGSNTLNGTYTASYEYYSSTYLSTASHRALMGLVIIVILFGLVYFGGSMFGVL